MPGETRLREPERTNTTELTTERETLIETESEHDLQTTDQFELQSQTKQVMEQEFSVEAGLNTSGRYGLTEVSRSLPTGFQQSKSESSSSAQSVARQIVSRAVERTFESVRERRQLTITNQVRELNRHKFENTPNDTPAADISGVYLWGRNCLRSSCGTMAPV